MKVLVTGGAGFIGTSLVKCLLDKKVEVIVVDNMKFGKKHNIDCFMNNKNFKFYCIDVEDTEKFCELLKEEKIDIVYHLAANTDIRRGENNPNIDFNNTFLTTLSVLELMRRNNIKNLFFASSSAIYGNKNTILSEQTDGLSPISYYGAAKAASEAFISSYTFMNDLNTLVLRFPNVVGPNITHGVIYDFINKLQVNSNELEILGDGTQTKPYMYIDDLIDAIILLTIEKGFKQNYNVFNIGVETFTSVTAIANIICNELGLKNVKYKYTGGKVGWKSDVPKFQFDIHKIHKEGWSAKYSSDEAVRLTIKNIKK